MQESGIIRLNIHGTKHMEWKEGLLVPLHYALSKLSRFARLSLAELDLMTMLSIEVASDFRDDVVFEVVDTAFEDRKYGKKLFHLVLPRGFLARSEQKRCKEVTNALLACILLYSNSLLTISHNASNPIHDIIDDAGFGEGEEILNDLYKNLVFMSDEILDVSFKKGLEIEDILSLPNSDNNEDLFLLAKVLELILLDNRYLGLLSDYIYLDVSKQQDAEDRDTAVANRDLRRSRR